MFKPLITLSIAIILSLISMAQWAPQGDKIKTQWAQQINVNNVLPEYPRPIMERQQWKNLNGLWQYAIKPVEQPLPLVFDGKILVPFAVESSLSGVMQPLGHNNALWYQNQFTIPANWKGNDILLHFGAVDWACDVFLNNIKIGSHTGGYTSFSFNITPFLKPGNQQLVVKVYDSTDIGFQPRGKQVNKPDGIWYTPVSGIWQTVWLEPVNNKHICNVKAVPNIDNKKLVFDIKTQNTLFADVVEVVVLNGNITVAKQKAVAGQLIECAIENVRLWSPNDPFLYNVEINLYSNNKLVDNVKSYAAMRKISTKRDANGIVRLQLNNKNCFQFGPLDQGYWPDGLYTAPTDEALLFDLIKTKEFGYNMVRKHVKVEPARWYTHCDRLGLIVWQDMPSGGESPQWQNRQYFIGNELLRSNNSEANYRKEWKEIIDQLAPYPCIAVWVPFNEAWGQFKTVEIVEWTKAYDPSRLVNPASGGNHYQTGDMLDLHNYPGPELYLYDAQRATVLGEYGGIGLPLKQHLWQPDRNWGYVQFKNTHEVTTEYIKYAEILKNMVKTGFSAAVYTQTTDVEGEVNGLITYDRKVVKLDIQRINKINTEICNSLNETK